jgi:hypothetical protein
MKITPILALAAIALPTAANANTYIERTVTSDGRIIDQRILEGRTVFGPEDSAIHAGAANVADDMLARDVAAAIAAEPALEGATVTVAARGGRVSLSGSAQSLDQAQRVERVARSVAGVASVSGTLDPQGS